MKLTIMMICSLLALTEVYGESYGDEVKGVKELMDSFAAASCRPGYSAISPEGRDVAYHCAGLIRKNPESKITFNNQNTVDFKGKYPYVSMFSCFFKKRGVVKDDGSALDHTKLDVLTKRLFNKPGGEESAKALHTDTLECEKKYPAKFTEIYNDGSVNKPFIDCMKEILAKCPH